jgi:hypothetical protein
MLRNHPVLQTEHVEPKNLVVLTITTGPLLAYVEDDHVVLGDHIQQLAFVVRREWLREASAKWG